MPRLQSRVSSDAHSSLNELYEDCHERLYGNRGPARFTRESRSRMLELTAKIVSDEIKSIKEEKHRETPVPETWLDSWVLMIKIGMLLHDASKSFPFEDATMHECDDGVAKAPAESQLVEEGPGEQASQQEEVEEGQVAEHVQEAEFQSTQLDQEVIASQPAEVDTSA